MVAFLLPIFIIIHSPFICVRLSVIDFFSLTMSLKMILLFVVPMFVGGCAILWIYWDHFKKPKKKIFISADCWLCVFDLLAPSQLGLGISMISHRFDFYVDEHFKTRKWALKFIGIGSKIRENGTKQMAIANYDWKPMPIPQIEMPRKVNGFECIETNFIDQNAIAFLGHFRQLFAAIFLNIWPMFAKNVCAMRLSATFFHRLRQFVPSILNEFPSLRVFSFYVANFFPEFPCDDSAAASDGQSVAKWLLTPPQSNVPKVLRCPFDTDDGILASNLEDLKATFANASSPVNFIVVIWFRPPSYGNSVVPFDLINELTREQLTLKRIEEYSNLFLLIRCLIARDESKWTKLEEEVIGWHFRDQWNQIDIRIYSDDDIGDGLLDSSPSPSDQQQK